MFVVLTIVSGVLLDHFPTVERNSKGLSFLYLVEFILPKPLHTYTNRKKKSDSNLGPPRKKTGIGSRSRANHLNCSAMAPLIVYELNQFRQIEQL